MYTGICKIDDDHRSILALASQLMRCPEREVPEIYRRLVTKLERAFGEEQNLMEESFFPATQCHLEQHARVMATLHRLHPAVMLGDCNSARRIGGKLLSDWLTLHASTQDAVMGVWVLTIQRPVMTALMKKRVGQERLNYYAPYGSQLPLRPLKFRRPAPEQSDFGLR